MSNPLLLERVFLAVFEIKMVKEQTKTSLTLEIRNAIYQVIILFAHCILNNELRNVKPET